MVKIKPKIVIDNLAKVQLREAYTYIKLDSPKSAEKVKAKILSSINELADYPEKYPMDKYRVIYHVSQEQITVIMIRHTKMEPKSH